MKFSATQLNQISNLCLDLAKGLFLASFAIPAIISSVTFLNSVRITITAIVLTLISLKITEIKEGKYEHK